MPLEDWSKRKTATRACCATLVGLLFILIGTGMTVVAFFDVKLSTWYEQRGNFTFVQLDETKMMVIKSTGYVGPIVMGCGTFILMIACVMTLENRDKNETKITLPPRRPTENRWAKKLSQSLKSDNMSSAVARTNSFSSCCPAPDTTDIGHADSEREHSDSEEPRLQSQSDAPSSSEHLEQHVYNISDVDRLIENAVVDDTEPDTGRSSQPFYPIFPERPPCADSMNSLYDEPQPSTSQAGSSGLQDSNRHLMQRFLADDQKRLNKQQTRAISRRHTDNSLTLMQSDTPLALPTRNAHSDEMHAARNRLRDTVAEIHSPPLPVSTTNQTQNATTTIVAKNTALNEPSSAINNSLRPNSNETTIINRNEGLPSPVAIEPAPTPDPLCTQTTVLLTPNVAADKRGSEASYKTALTETGSEPAPLQTNAKNAL